MKRMIKYYLLIVAISLVLCAFIEFDINPQRWSTHHRAAAVIIPAAIAGMVCFIEEI